MAGRRSFRLLSVQCISINFPTSETMRNHDWGLLAGANEADAVLLADGVVAEGELFAGDEAPVAERREIAVDELRRRGEGLEGEHVNLQLLDGFDHYSSPPFLFA